MPYQNRKDSKPNKIYHRNINLKRFGIIMSITLIFIGVAVLYLWSYKDNKLINGTSMTSTFLGWMILMASLFGERLLSEKKIIFRQNKIKWIKDKTIKLAVYASFSVAGVGCMLLVDTAVNKRTKNILDNQPTQTAIATVVKIESRNTRGGPEEWAIFNYNVQNETVKQSVYNGAEKYSVDQRYIIRYSIEYPEMFYIIRLVK